MRLRSRRALRIAGRGLPNGCSCSHPGDANILCAAAEFRGDIENVAAGNRRSAELKRKISALGTPNLGAIEEYARVNERYSYLASQRDDVLNS